VRIWISWLYSQQFVLVRYSECFHDSRYASKVATYLGIDASGCVWRGLDVEGTVADRLFYDYHTADSDKGLTKQPDCILLYFLWLCALYL